VCCESCCGCTERLRLALGRDANRLHQALREFYEQDPEYAPWVEALDRRVKTALEEYDPKCPWSDEFSHVFEELNRPRSVILENEPVITVSPLQTTLCRGCCIGLTWDRRFGWSDAVVQEISNESVFAGSGLEPGMKILSVNGEPCLWPWWQIEKLIERLLKKTEAITIEAQRVEFEPPLLHYDERYFLLKTLAPKPPVGDCDSSPRSVVLGSFFDFGRNEQADEQGEEAPDNEMVDAAMRHYFQRHIRLEALEKAGVAFHEGMKAKLVLGAENFPKGELNKIMLGCDWGIILLKDQEKGHPNNMV